MRKYNIDDLEAALIDLLDGQSCWYKIQEATGLSAERSQEIEDIYIHSYKLYKRRHNI